MEVEDGEESKCEIDDKESESAAGRPARRTRKPTDAEKKKRREYLLEMIKEVRDEELETSRKRLKQEEGREDEKVREGTVEQKIPGKVGAVTVDETTADAENGDNFREFEEVSCTFCLEQQLRKVQVKAGCLRFVVALILTSE